MKTNQEILEKAIQKAIDGGWEPYKTITEQLGYAPAFTVSYDYQSDTVSIKVISDGGALVNTARFSIFNHDFAKSLWGEELEYYEELDGVAENWKVHLQQMVIADDPIKYLGEHTG